MVEKMIKGNPEEYKCCYDCIISCGFSNVTLCDRVKAEIQLRQAHPCPKCGSTNVLALDDGDPYDGIDGLWIICCDNCSAMTDNYPTEELAIAAWNRGEIE